MKSPEALEIGLRYAHPPPNSIQHTHALTLSLSLSLIRLKYEFVKMQEEEQVLRDKILLEGVETCMRMPKGEENKDDENKQCVQCMADCYLSAIMCPCRPNDVACLRHSKKISFLSLLFPFLFSFFSFPFSFFSFPISFSFRFFPLDFNLPLFLSWQEEDSGDSLHVIRARLSFECIPGGTTKVSIRQCFLSKMYSVFFLFENKKASERFTSMLCGHVACFASILQQRFMSIQAKAGRSDKSNAKS